MADILKTPLFAWHQSHGAKMAPFAGWDMPIQYEGIIQEHNHTRSHASVFDICHMGQFVFKGQGMADALSCAVSHNLETLKTGKCRYGFLLNSQGGVIDDLIIYRLGDDEFLAVVNAARAADDLRAFRDRLEGDGRQVEDVSPLKGKVDLQGPASLEVMEKVFGQSFRDLGYFSFREISFEGEPLLVSRTGYTGELGYELYPPRNKTLALWEALLADGRVKPAGLGARDTLRLECGLALYGHELDENHTPAEAGMGGMLTSSALFVGHLAACEIKKDVLVGLALEGRRTVRNGDAVLLPGTQTVIGTVTSGSFAPSLGHAVALAYVAKEHADREHFSLVSGKATLNANKTGLPFYKNGTARTKLQ